jgi:capsular exopolysaccharide synthesis family protein
LLRTNIKFTIPEGVKCPIIGVTSSIRGEGKSTTAVNLSYVLANKGHKVLLVDGDLRIPSIAKKMGVKSTPGLTDLLIGSTADIASWKSDIHKNWYILPSGDIPPNPSELLGSKRMENVLNVLSEHFDYIIVDLPPVNIVSDAMAISSYITGLIIVIREGYTSKKDLDRCMRQIKLSDVNVLGCVMNESEEGSASYSKYGRYSRHKHYYSEEYKIQDKEEFNL